MAFQGYLIKVGTGNSATEIPLRFMRAETYSVTPDQRMEWSAERDITGVLHRDTVENMPPKIEFKTPLMTNKDIVQLNTIIQGAFTNQRERKLQIEFYDPESDSYKTWECYMPDVQYQIRNVDVARNIVNYQELRFAFIGY